MIIGPTGDQPQSGFGKLLGQGAAVCDDLGGVSAKFGREGFPKAYRFGRDDVHQRPSLGVGENGRVYFSGQFAGGQDEAATGTAEAFLGGGGHDLGVRHRRWVDSARDQPGYVSHVHHQWSVHRIGDRPKTREIDRPGIGAASGDDERGPVLLGQPLHLVVIDGLGLPVHAIGHEVV